VPRSRKYFATKHKNRSFKNSNTKQGAHAPGACALVVTLVFSKRCIHAASVDNLALSGYILLGVDIDNKRFEPQKQVHQCAFIKYILSFRKSALSKNLNFSILELLQFFITD